MNQHIKNSLSLSLNLEESKPLKVGLAVGGFALLTAVAALIRIPLPFSPVPITMQTFVVLLSGIMLGSVRGSISQGIYVAAGAIGLPIFAGMASGLALLAGPTGGFLAGFIIAPPVVAYVMSGSNDRLRLVLALTAGTAIIFLTGNLWLWKVTGGTFSAALKLGFYPFIPGAIIKAGLIVAIVEAIKFRRNNN